MNDATSFACLRFGVLEKLSRKVMAERLALKEDRTSTGGRVISGSSSWFAEDGRPFALAEDKATCGNCEGAWPIAGTAHDCMDEGRAMVRDLARVYCPCRSNFVHASGSSSFYWSEAGGDPSVAKMPVQQAPATDTTQTTNAKHVQWVYAQDAHTGAALGNRDIIADLGGSKVSARTDEQGYAMFETDSEQPISIHVLFHSPARKLNPSGI